MDIDLKQLAALMHSLSPEQRAHMLNLQLSGLDKLLGMQFVSIADDSVVATLEADPRHVQPYGLVHGGVYAAIGESVCSVGAAVSVLSQGLSVVGIENTTRFLHGTRPGTTLTATARPSDAVQTPHRASWVAEITDQDGTVCARSQVIVAKLAAGRKIAGESVMGPNIMTDDAR